nr:hypothetical protein [Pandoravirus belohorizontensis]
MSDAAATWNGYVRLLAESAISAPMMSSSDSVRSRSEGRLHSSASALKPEPPCQPTEPTGGIRLSQVDPSKSASPVGTQMPKSRTQRPRPGTCLGPAATAVRGDATTLRATAKSRVKSTASNASLSTVPSHDTQASAFFYPKIRIAYAAIGSACLFCRLRILACLFFSSFS